MKQKQKTFKLNTLQLVGLVAGVVAVTLGVAYAFMFYPSWKSQKMAQVKPVMLQAKNTYQEVMPGAKEQTKTQTQAMAAVGDKMILKDELGNHELRLAGLDQDGAMFELVGEEDFMVGSGQDCLNARTFRLKFDQTEKISSCLPGSKNIWEFSLQQ